jgi:hypothetical protein
LIDFNHLQIQARFRAYASGLCAAGLRQKIGEIKGNVNNPAGMFLLEDSCAMNQIFEIVDIIAFDVHTCIPPLQNPALVVPEFQFLLDPAAYAKQHGNAKEFSVRGLTLDGLASKRYQSNFFWRQCASIYHDGTQDPWKLQIPFHCTMPISSIQFDAGLPNTRTILIPSLYLSSMGWSSSLHVRIFGSLGAAETYKLMVRLRKDKAFTVEKSPMALSEVFSRFSETFKNNLYVPPPPRFDRPTTQRYIVLSFAKFRVSPVGSAPPGPMSDADRAEIHSMLLGRQIDIPELAINEQKQKYLQIDYSELDFMLTYFGIGTLIWMEDRSRPRGRSALWCLASNIGACSMYALTLADFLRSTEQTSKAAQKVAGLRDGIQYTVGQLGAAYSNRFCRGFLRSHTDLKEFAG